LRIIDKIRNYINDKKMSSELKVGDRLPSSAEMMKIFGGSYATIRAALSKLEEEGLVDIAVGTGTFVAGARNLDIDIYCLTTTLEFEKFEALLKKHILKNNLYINVRLKDVFNLIERKEIISPNQERKVILVECAPEMNYNISGLYNFIGYEGYEELQNSLINIPSNYTSAALPYYSSSSQMGINNELLQQAGFSLEKITGDFAWWDEYVKSCKLKGIVPASCIWEKNSKWPFGSLYSLLFSLKLNESGSPDALYKQQSPYFHTKGGKRFMEIMDDCECVSADSPKLFFNGGSGINFMLGSWITAQNKKRKNINVDNLKIVPYYFGRKKICNMLVNSLRTYLYSGITEEEKQRTWKFLKMLLSRDFQKELCSLSGMLSVRKDIEPEDYSWYCEEYAAFMPTENDIMIYNNIFSRNMKAYFTGLFEQFKFYGADKDLILKCMDAKL